MKIRLKRLREIMKKEGAESVDAAREQWWVGLRSAEENHYSRIWQELCQR